MLTGLIRRADVRKTKGNRMMLPEKSCIWYDDTIPVTIGPICISGSFLDNVS
jgi:hypothetical protein